ncbi:hypothetical protein [Flavobacterium sp.]|uniref:hypothetical protein n=1 Tax=Flavobacterium sp. TaxID=239 RepID=UPI00352833FB
MQIAEIEGEIFFKIENSDKIRPFFMSIVSDSNHWMFISSNGGISAGRQNADFSLFPYYTDDKITESNEVTGSKTIVKIKKDNQVIFWEPFSVRNCNSQNITRNLYKSQYGNCIVFEEIHNDFNLVFSYKWQNSDQYGFVKTANLTSKSAANYEIEIVDGLQNILPANVGSDLQRASSNLVDAYKRTEIDETTGLGIFALSAVIVDKAEPSEALKANVVWSFGIENPTYLLSSLQLDSFRANKPLQTESDIKGEKGAYFIATNFSLEPNQSKEWSFVANLNFNHVKVIELLNQLEDKNSLFKAVQANIKEGTENLIKLTASADALQKTSDFFKDTRHYSNVLFNIMRGGIFDDNYTVEKEDFLNYFKKANKALFEANLEFLNALPQKFNYFTFTTTTSNHLDNDFKRLAKEYLPLKFSRRHGDPSRPWNKFSINTKNETDGSKILDYEGNWRDIFQNWEALAYSFPCFLEGMIYKFLNASTFDGYNPYRVTKDGFDWETIEKDDPWSYIGYWGDHQIIYLLKFLELSESFFPQKIASILNTEQFVYAAVPYKIKPFNEIVENPKDTIVFDHNWDKLIREKREQIGSDGALLTDEKKEIYKVSFLEKILATSLAKLSNFIPEGGIWMNTQRPEWNDANNALVGNGISMVTLYYLRRFLAFFKTIINETSEEQFKISNELVEFYHSIRATFYDFQDTLQTSFTDAQRYKMVTMLGQAASEYRTYIYENGFWGKKRSISKNELEKFITVALQFVDHSIRKNRRNDKLYHAYNLLQINEGEMQIEYLNEMLEGQVAVLSSGLLNTTEVLDVLDGLKASQLFREDQYSYLLYPNKKLPGFLDRNTISENLVKQSKLLQQLVHDKNNAIIEQDVKGNYHFNARFNNVNFLREALYQLPNNYQDLVKTEQNIIETIYEKVFNHKQFTGRSGTFYAYEGLGSIYWHMVSKLLLAATECTLSAIKEKSSQKDIGKILDHYYEIQAGIGVHKSPKLYGAFPTDPYSHTPWHRGAQQPGMTGQVKEDIISRWFELGVHIKEGKLYLEPNLLRVTELNPHKQTVQYFAVNGQLNELELQENSLFFTYCQVPIVYELANENAITVALTNGEISTQNTNCLPVELSRKIYYRTNEIQAITVKITRNKFKD